ncbi:MAG: hypothetical protein K2G60_03705, partial [Oscillospiraceae bacterium]|nr:hypothetical protein [Oscillospiraceae bacterium]
IAAVLLICTLASCGKNGADVSNTQPSASYSYTDTSSDASTQGDNTSQPDNSNTKPTASQAPSETETKKENKVVTYISENPDNVYICRVADKYGSDKANLMAFIKVNSSTPGATVLEFSGKRDSNGNLVVTAEELKYVYEVSDNGTMRRASSDGKNNDGYNKLIAKTVVKIAEKYLIPSIDEMREKRRYEDYFKD